ncbi:MAG: LCP family protein [Pleurocapsa sp. SU_196_0]|nr:LCP family protein [Pleurocapsa sp. SU_196_0]
MRLRRFIPLVFLGLLVAFGFWIAPAWGVISRFAAFPSNPSQPVTILLAGVGHAYKYYHQRASMDEDFKRGLTDTMVVVQLNPAQRAIKLLSVPRDTRVGAGFTSNDKINAAMLGGPDSERARGGGIVGVETERVSDGLDRWHEGTRGCAWRDSRVRATGNEVFRHGSETRD